MADPLVHLDRVTAVRTDGSIALCDLTWSLRDGEIWAITGPVGSGKTAFAELLCGRLAVRRGSIAWPFLGPVRPSDAIRLLTFREESRLFAHHQHYYQERFNFSDPLAEIALGDYLRAGGRPEAAVRAMADRLGVGGLLAASFITLSNGQSRRARLARALLARPELLILDDPFLGLDATGQEEVDAVLEELVNEGTRLLLIAPPEPVPAWVTHVLELEEGRAVRQGVVGRNPSPTPPLTGEGLSPPSLSGKGAGGLGEGKNPSPDPSPERGVEEERNGPSPERGGEKEGTPVIALRDVTVRYGARTILDCISWTVRPGERWAVLGPNGSGKSTLLSLVCGDHPQAYANDVRVFGRRRGTGESIWDLKKRIGLVSPELHLYFTEPLTARRTAATGFTDTMTARPTTPQQDAVVARLFAEFGLTAVAERPFARLSTGQQRLVLLVRALVKGPELLILDEPFQGLDRAAMENARAWLDVNIQTYQTLVMVTHDPAELPRSVTKVLRLEAGRRV
jgi:molybdate transport system ATP-binding protein